MLRRSLILLSAGRLLSGCSPSTVRSSLGPIDPEFLQPCASLTRLSSGSHQEIEGWAIRTAFEFRSCSERHKALVEIVKVRQDVEAEIEGGRIGSAR